MTKQKKPAHTSSTGCDNFIRAASANTVMSPAASSAFTVPATRPQATCIQTEKRIRVLLTASTFPRYSGDTEPRFILDLAEALTEYCDVTVLVPAAPEAKPTETMGHVNVIRYPYFPLRRAQTLCYPGAIVPRIKEKKTRILLVPFLFLSLWIHVRKYEKQYDLVNAHWLIPQGIVQAFCRKPYLITGHGADVTSLNRSIMKILKKRCLKHASMITVVSDKLAKSLKEHYDTTDITVCPMGCNLSTFGPSNKENDFFGAGKKTVVFIGRLAEKKGVCYLIEAMEHINAKLIIVGDGPLLHELKRQAEQSTAEIHFWGKKSHDEIKTILASADVCAVPSVTASDGDTEGLPVTIMEAMASGVPVIASNSGGIAELIRDGYNGILTAEKDVNALTEGINKLLSDTNFTHEVIKNASVSIQNYDYSNIAAKYFSMYQSILQNQHN